MKNFKVVLVYLTLYCSIGSCSWDNKQESVKKGMRPPYVPEREQIINAMRLYIL
jgi:hypothetical protein